MKKLKLVALVLVLFVGWTAFLMFGVSDGFILRPLTTGERSEAFISEVENLVANEYVGNLALLLIEDGKADATFFHSVDKPVDENSVFHMASISKWVSAWGIFKLVQDGKLDLDAPVDSYLTRWNLPESDYDNSKVTIRKLLSHTSGLVDDLGYAGFGPDEHVQTIEESLTQAADAPWSDGRAIVGLEPGSQYMYSGAAYTLLQLVIEEVSGQSFQDYMTENVLLPLDMTHSTFVWPDSTSWDRVTSYDVDGTEAPYRMFTALAAASLYTTISDLERFVEANRSPNEVLSASTLDIMFTPHAFVNETGIHALGPTIFARNDDGVVIYGHDGYGDPAKNTAARINLDSGDGIIVFETGHAGIASTIADHWIFWKTGIADFVVIMDNKNWLLTLLFGGYFVILVGVFFRTRKKRSSR